MKSLLTMFFFNLLMFGADAQNPVISISSPDSTKKIQIVDASCGQCQFQLAGKGCNLAIRKDGKAYFVDGTTIDEHGDAHAKDGFCLAIKKAEVQGEVINNRFKVTYFKLIKPAPQKELKPNGG